MAKYQIKLKKGIPHNFSIKSGGKFKSVSLIPSEWDSPYTEEEMKDRRIVKMIKNGLIVFKKMPELQKAAPVAMKTRAKKEIS